MRWPTLQTMESELTLNFKITAIYYITWPKISFHGEGSQLSETEKWDVIAVIQATVHEIFTRRRQEVKQEMDESVSHPELATIHTPPLSSYSTVYSYARQTCSY